MVTVVLICCIAVVEILAHSHGGSSHLTTLNAYVMLGNLVARSI